MIIVGFDPGETTGYAVVETKERGEFPAVLERGVLAQWHGIRRLLDTYSPELIIAEEFRLYASKAQAQVNSNMIAPQVLGVIKYLGEIYHIPIILQGANLGKFVRLPQEVFTALNSAHERDALCHIMAYLNTADVVG